jgi:hypothetical protein
MRTMPRPRGPAPPSVAALTVEGAHRRWYPHRVDVNQRHGRSGDVGGGLVSGAQACVEASGEGGGQLVQLGCRVEQAYWPSSSAAV